MNFVVDVNLHCKKPIIIRKYELKLYRQVKLCSYYSFKKRRNNSEPIGYGGFSVPSPHNNALISIRTNLLKYILLLLYSTHPIYCNIDKGNCK